MKFLPDNYKAPSSSEGYMKILSGENRIRILSQPICGWEDWVENKPIRYQHNAKPEKSFDAEKPIKHFWAMIVWNYREERIQILQVSSAAIRKTITELCANDDWGLPYAYDISIKKEGEKMTTKYSATPIPPKPISEHIKKAFNETPIYLEALFGGADPFGNWPEYTKGCFENNITTIVRMREAI